MASVGEQLRAEREARGRTLAEVAAATGIDVAYLVALEGDDFHALPGKAFGKFYIRAYADLLDFDAQRLIDAYDAEAERILRESAPRPRPREEAPLRPVAAAIARWRESKQAEREGRATGTEAADDDADAEPGFEEAEADLEHADEAHLDSAEDESAVAAVPTTASASSATSTNVATIEFVSAPLGASASDHGRAADRPRRRPAIAVAAMSLAGIALLAWAFHAMVTGRRTEENRPSLDASIERPVTTSAPPARPSVERAPGPAPETKRSVDPPLSRSPVAEASAAPSRLAVNEFAVGRKVVERRIQDPANRFRSGEVVWFATRVRGGRSGERIRHVWLQDGREVHGIGLELGGEDWSTYSRATVRFVGEWAVEARDTEGRMLARQTFIVAP